jgi:uncharacterized protein (DUF1499 family)
MLRALKWLVYLVIALAVLLLAAGQAGMLIRTPPPDLGFKDGELKPPSNTENSVSSQASLYPTHPMKDYAQVAPFPVTGESKAALDRLYKIVAGMERAQILKAEPGYLHAQFTSKWMKFGDDLELAVDESAKVIHVRSASRLGRKDFGANRARVEAIRAQYAKSG